jgi:hypothetical protein
VDFGLRGEGEAEAGGVHAGMHKSGRGTGLRGDFGEEEIVGGVVGDAVHGSELLDGVVEGVAGGGEGTHMAGGGGVEFADLAGLRMGVIHGNAEPDVLDFDVLEPVRIEALDVILVAVGGDNEVEAFGTGLFSGGEKVGGNVFDGGFE